MAPDYDVVKHSSRLPPAMRASSAGVHAPEFPRGFRPAATAYVFFTARIKKMGISKVVAVGERLLRRGAHRCGRRRRWVGGDLL